MARDFRLDGVERASFALWAWAYDGQKLTDRPVHTPIPLVSIIMPAHNHAAFVETALGSIAAQTHPHIELIVIDDGSSDDTAEVIARSLGRLARPMRIEFHQQENRGLGHTLARALTFARGDFVQFLASDDALLPDMTARLVAAFQQAGPDVAAIGCDGYVFDGRNQPHMPFRQVHPVPFSRNQHRELMVGNWLPAMGLLYRTELVKQAGGFDPDLVYEDWGLLLTLSRTCRIAQIPDRLFLYRRHDRNASADRERMHLALQALAARFPQMATARALRVALAARSLSGILAALSPGALDLAMRFALRQMQHRLARPAGWPRFHLRRHPVVSGAGRVQIGPGCHIHPDAVLKGGAGALVLGAGCRVGAGARLVAGAGLTIGAGTFIEAGAQIGGVGRTTRIGRACLITAQSVVEGGTNLGEMCATMPGDRVTGNHARGSWILPPAGDQSGTGMPRSSLS